MHCFHYRAYPCPATCVFSEGWEGRKIGLTSKSNKATGLKCSASGCAPADGADGIELLVVHVCLCGRRMTGSLAQLRVAVGVLPATHGCGVRAQSRLLFHGKGWPAGERQNHCSQPAAEAEVYSLEPGPDVLVGNCLCQSWS